MVLFDTIFLAILAASSTVIAAAAVGIYRRITTLVDSVEKHDRTLYGEPDVEGWQGLVARVASHEAELDESREESLDRPEHD